MAIFSRYADTNGDGSGTKAATGDYSSAAEDFYISCPVLYRSLHVYRAVIHIEDTTGMQVQDYGNITSGLTNGIEVLVTRDGVTRIDLTDGLPIKTNGQWTRVCHDVDVKSWGSGNEVCTIRWTFSKAGSPIVIDGAHNEALVFRVNDLMTGLLDHTFLIQGVEFE